MPCDANGNFLPEDRPPAAREEPHQPDDWFPYDSKESFELAELIYTGVQMSAGHIDELLRIWSVRASNRAPFLSHKHLYHCIDSTTIGEVPWQEFSLQYGGEVDDSSPSWKQKSFAVHYRDPVAVAKDILANTSFADSMDYVPYLDFDSLGDRQYHNFMSGNYAWEQAVRFFLSLEAQPYSHHTPSQGIITKQSVRSHGAMLVSVILGSDKTTVSVGTGQNEYYPIYMSIGNIHNSARRAHQGGVVLLGFLAMPKCEH